MKIKLTGDIIKTYQNALLGPLNKAASEVKDPEIAVFSQNLIKSYELKRSVQVAPPIPRCQTWYRILPEFRRRH